MVALTAGEAAAAIEAAAWTDNPRDEAYREAIEALEVMIARNAGPFTGREIRAAIDIHVPTPRRLIHTVSRSGFGADWTEESAVAFARKPGAECFWTWHLMRHDLKITADYQEIRFEVAAPEGIRARLLEARRAAIAEAYRG
jgi:hypothetical protein